MKKPSDVIISASPEFLLEPICNRLGIGTLMASRTDKHTGQFSGKNCHGEEKVVRFRSLFPKDEVDEFYSDLYCDTPMARLAKRAYIVKGERLKPWKESKLTPKK
jgi:phosphoserine phosphatase